MLIINKEFINWLYYIIGFFISSLGIYAFINANVGVGTGESVSIGLTLYLPISVGFGFMMIHGVIVLLNSFINKKLPNAFVIFPILLRGLTVDFWIFLLGDRKLESLVSGSILLLLGITLMGIGLGLYLKTTLPKIPVDDFILSLSKINKLSFRKNRILFELSLLLIGWSLGGPVGIGTLVIALTLGPSIQFWNKKFENLKF